MRKRALMMGCIFLGLPLLTFAQSAAPPTDITTVLNSFRHAMSFWVGPAERIAQDVFTLLATIEFAIAAGMLVLQGSDIPTWTATITRKILAIGGFYALLINGPVWMQAVIDSFCQYGSMASGVKGITAGDTMADGVDIVTTLLVTAAGSGWANILLALVCVGCSAAIFLAYFKLSKAFVMVKVESYITIAAAAIQLGWGASRFTQNYAERYIASAFATGIKLMCFYLIIGVGRALSPGWIEQASLVSAVVGGITNMVTLTTSVMIFCALADIDKMAAAIFSGAPQFSGHDFTNSYSPIVSAGLSAASFGAGIATSGLGTAIGGAASAWFSGGARAASAGFGGGGSSAWRGFAMATAIGSGSTSRAQQPVAAPRLAGASVSQRLLPPPGRS